MKIADAAELKRMDEEAIGLYGVSLEALIESAAQALKAELLAVYGRSCRYAVVCGPGNNGQDGAALTRLLWNEQIDCLLCTKEEQTKRQKAVSDLTVPSADKQEQRNKPKETKRENSYSYAQIDAVLRQADVIVDALFGTGLHRPLSGEYARLVQAINACGKPVVACDIPSGMDADGSWFDETIIQADRTVSFACIKKGMLCMPQRGYCGKIVVRNIALPPAVVRCTDDTLVLDAAQVGSWLPKRRAHSHKGTYGRVLLIGGSRQMSGAVVLCAKALLRSGAGLLTCMIPDCIHPMLAAQLQEAMFEPLPSDAAGHFHEAFLPDLEQLQQYDLIVAGNGMGRCHSTRRIIERVLQSEVACIIDGDGLYEIGKGQLLPDTHRQDVLLTPHLKELSYLSEAPFDAICRRPWEAATSLIQRYPYVSLIVKDDWTWILSRDKRALNIIGNDGLATGGSGDVLCGMAGGLYAQSGNAFASACCAVYAHAWSADRLASQMDTMSLLPSDIICELPQTYRLLRQAGFKASKG